MSSAIVNSSEVSELNSVFYWGSSCSMICLLCGILSTSVCLLSYCSWSLYFVDQCLSIVLLLLFIVFCRPVFVYCPIALGHCILSTTVCLLSYCSWSLYFVDQCLSIVLLLLVIVFCRPVFVYCPIALVNVFCRLVFVYCRNALVHCILSTSVCLLSYCSWSLYFVDSVCLLS
jgi:hypothetical protein